MNSGIVSNIVADAFVFIEVAVRQVNRLDKYAPSLSAGLVGASAAILLSLPLRSPHDALMNAGSIGVACIAVTILLAVASVKLERVESADAWFGAICVFGFVLSGAGAMAVQTIAELERTVAFVLPLTTVQFGLIGVLTPVFRWLRVTSIYYSIPLLAVTVGLGVTFASHGDQPSGQLSLPERTTGSISAPFEQTGEWS
jgi:hypothetical protein